MDLKQLSEVAKKGKSVWPRSRKFRWEYEVSEIKLEIAQLEKEIAMNKPLVEELLKENEETKTIITSTMDNWIQNQGWL